MASSYSSRIRLEKQGSGENANTWGSRLNSNVIDLVDAAVAGVTAVDVDGQGGNGVTLTANNGSSDQARSFGLRMTGALSADVTVSYSTAPEKIYFVNNETAGGYNVIMDNGSTKVTVGNGAALIATEGSNSYAIRDFESGTRLAFNQNTAPQGWTIITSASHAGAALRIVNAAVSGAQVGGSSEFTSVFKTGIVVSIQGDTNPVYGQTGSTAITTAQIPSHQHEGFAYYRVDGGQHTWPGSNSYAPDTIYHQDSGHTNSNTNVMGRAGVDITKTMHSDGTQINTASGHSHSLGSHYHYVSLTDSFDLDVKYVNFIVCQKD